MVAEFQIQPEKRSHAHLLTLAFGLCPSRLYRAKGGLLIWITNSKSSSWTYSPIQLGWPHDPNRFIWTPWTGKLSTQLNSNFKTLVPLSKQEPMINMDWVQMYLKTCDGLSRINNQSHQICVTSEKPSNGYCNCLESTAHSRCPSWVQGSRCPWTLSSNWPSSAITALMSRFQS